MWKTNMTLSTPKISPLRCRIDSRIVLRAYAIIGATTTLSIERNLSKFSSTNINFIYNLLKLQETCSKGSAENIGTSPDRAAYSAVFGPLLPKLTQCINRACSFIRV